MCFVTIQYISSHFHNLQIDLCNNPMTKEAKLSAAQRIVPEWKDYDAEIKNLMARIDDEQHQEQSTWKQKKGKGEARRDTYLPLYSERIPQIISPCCFFFR
jgi:hypothetical protein